MKKTLFFIACFVMGVSSTMSNVSADIVFDADPTNTTIGSNDATTGTLSGTVGNLNFQNSGNGFNFSGFFSTSNINTLNGAAITAADTVSTSITVSGLSVGVLRANGIEFGLQSDIADGINNLQLGDLVVRAESSNNGGDIGTFFNGGGFDDSGVGGTTATITDGFTITLDADVSGYTFTLDSIGGSQAVISGDFAPGEFVDIVGTGHFFYAQQQFNSANNGVNLLANITQASVHVTTAAVPEPSSLALLAIGAVGICVRRRR